MIDRLGNIIIVFRFILLVLLQVMLLDNLNLGRSIHPMVYPLFIALLPLEWPQWINMIIAAFVGLSVDAFSNTIGFHMSTAVFLMTMRPLILNVLSPREGYDQGFQPGWSLGFNWLLFYFTLITFVHHTWFFLLERFSFSYLGATIGKVLVSSLFSVVLMVLIYLLFFAKGKK